MSPTSPLPPPKDPTRIVNKESGQGSAPETTNKPKGGSAPTKFTFKKRTSHSGESRTSSIGRPSACVFVASLNASMLDKSLLKSVRHHFSKWGKISTVKVLRDPANRPYAFVQYSTNESANMAVVHAQHSVLNGRTIRVEKARVNRTLFVSCAASRSTEDFKAELEGFGEIERIVAVDSEFHVSPEENVGSGWFVKFAYRQDAIAAYSHYRSEAGWHTEWAQNLDDEYSDTPEITTDKTSIFVGKLDKSVTRSQLLRQFSKHGKIVEHVLVCRPVANFAFITYKDPKAASAAVNAEDHTLLGSKKIQVQFREIYNNYRKRDTSTTEEPHAVLPLNLAPPPVAVSIGPLAPPPQFVEVSSRNKVRRYSQGAAGAASAKGKKVTFSAPVGENPFVIPDSAERPSTQGSSDHENTDTIRSSNTLYSSAPKSVDTRSSAGESAEGTTAVPLYAMLSKNEEGSLPTLVPASPEKAPADAAVAAAASPKEAMADEEELQLTPSPVDDINSPGLSCTAESDSCSLSSEQASPLAEPPVGCTEESL